MSYPIIVIFIAVALMGMGIGGYIIGTKSQIGSHNTPRVQITSQSSSPTDIPISPLPIPTKIFTPNPIPTRELIALQEIQYSSRSDWQTYSDDVAKFSIQYDTNPIQPYNAHMSLGVAQTGKSVSILSCNTALKNPEVCMSGYTITAYSNYSGGSRRVWLKDNLEGTNICQRYYADIMIAKKNAIVSTSDCSSFGDTTILIPNGNQMIVFTSSGYIRDDVSGLISLPQWVREALSTFRFL